MVQTPTRRLLSAGAKSRACPVLPNDPPLPRRGSQAMAKSQRREKYPRGTQGKSRDRDLCLGILRPKSQAWPLEGTGLSGEGTAASGD